MEKPFQFLSDYYGSHKKLKRDFSIKKPGRGELALDSNWQIFAPREKSRLLDWALSDFCEYLQNCMDVKMDVHSSASPKRASASIILEKTVRNAEEKKQLSVEGSFHISCSEEKIRICSLSDMGLKEALFYLEDLISLKEAPVLKKETTTKVPLRQDRICMIPQFGNYEEYLALLSHYGFNGIFFTPNNDLKPGEFKEKSGYSYEEIIAKTEKYGLGIWSSPGYGGAVWISKIDGCLSAPEGRNELRAIGRRHSIPEMKGMCVCYEGLGLFYSKKCFYHDLHWDGKKLVYGKGRINTRCPRCAQAGGPEIVYARMMGDLYEGMKSVAPHARLIVWPYAWPDLAKNMDIDKFLSHLPKEVILMPTWEQTIQTKNGGRVFDYSISRTGPSTHFQRYIQSARKHGHRAYANVNTTATWDAWTVPYIQTPLEWIKRYKKINASRVTGSFETWSSGFHPSFVGELAKWFSWKPVPDGKKLLEMMIKRDFGPRSVRDAMSAWRYFGRAIRQAPLDIGYEIAWIPKYNIDCLVGRALWPRDIFKIKKEVVDRVKEWDNGMQFLKRAYENSEPSKKENAGKILSVAIHTGQIFKSVRHCVLFAVKKAKGIIDESLVKAELRNKEELLKTIQADSRLGLGDGWGGAEIKSPFFRKPKKYCYLPQDIKKAIAQLKNVGLELAQDPESRKPAVAVEVKNTSAQVVTAELEINECPKDWQMEKKKTLGPIKKGASQTAYLVVNNISKQDMPVELRLTAKIGDEIVEATREIRKIWLMPRLKAQIKIDGALTEEEWGQAEVMKIDKKEQIVVGDGEKWKGAKDLSGTIFTLWDEKNLYLGAKVKCRHLIQNKKEAEINRIYDGTCLELFLSLNPITAIWNSSPKDSDYQLSFAPRTKNNPRCYFVGVRGQGKVMKLTGIEMAACQVEGGYEMEIKIPWNNFEAFKPEAGQVIGFDVALDGANEKGNREYQMVWAGTPENCRDVSAFAKVILQDE